MGTLLLGASSVYAQGLITTVAGSAWTFPAGPISPATNAPLGAIQGVAVDSAGNVYATDFGNRTVVKISGTTLTVLAGNGTFGFSGDGGPGTSAAISLAFGLVADRSGNVFLADTLNHRIRKISPAGTITTVAGNGTAGFSGDNGPATQAALSFPTSVAVDASGNLYIADRDNHRIRKVSANGAITTIAGNGSARFSGDGASTSISLNQPSGVAVDGSGKVFIADTLNHRIRELSGGSVTTVAGNGTEGSSGDGQAATGASVNNPTGVAVDGFGNLYIADNFNNRIRVVSGGIISTVAGSGGFSFSGDGGPATGAALAVPYAVAVDASGTLFIADSSNNRIRKVAGGIISTIAGNGLFKFAGDNGPALSASMNSPVSVVSDASGNFYIADSLNNRVRKVSSNGVITTFAGTGAFGFGGDNAPGATALLNSPVGLAADSNSLYVADLFNHRIRRVNFLLGIISTVAGDGDGRFSGDGLAALNSSLNQPSGVALDAQGNLYIADKNNHRIRKVSGGIITTVAGTGVRGPSADGGPATFAALNNPVSVAVDTSGNIFIADRDNHRVRKVTVATGVMTTVAGSGTAGFSGDNGPGSSAALNTPSGVAVDSAGNIFIADAGNHRVRKVTASTGAIQTVAGDGSFGSSGDGGLSTVASLGGPQGVFVDATGSLYIADTFNDRIRRIFAGALAAGLVQGPPGATVRIPVTLGLFGGSTVDSLAFGLRITPNAPAPALSGTLSFAASAPVPAPNGPVAAGTNDIGVSWLSQTTAPFPLSGAVQLGEVRASIPATARDGQTYTIEITGANGSLGSTPVSLLPGTNAMLTVVQSGYLVGDSFPAGLDLNGDGDKNDAGEFGDNQLTVLDLVDALRAVTRVPGFRPLCPSDRYDALDSSPPDTTSRGGDGTLDTADLMLTLKRVTNLDTSRPRRTSGGAPSCPAGANAMPGFETLSRGKGRDAMGETSESGTLEFGEAEAGASGTLRIPVYLRAQENLALAGLSFGLGFAGRSSLLRFVPGPGPAPTLVDDALPGTLSVAWLEGLSLAAGERLLLGYVEALGVVANENATALLRVYGVVANARQDGRSIGLAFAESVAVRTGRQLR